MSATANAPPNPARPTPRPGRPAAPRGTSRSRRAADALFKYTVIAGGVSIILSILGILVFVGWEAWPLTSGARVEVREPIEIAGFPAGALVADEYRENAVQLGTDGVVRQILLSDGSVVDRWPLQIPPVVMDDDPERSNASEQSARASPRPVARVETLPGSHEFVFATDDGRVHLLPLRFDVTFDDEQRRTIAPRFGDVVSVLPAEGGGRAGPFTIRHGDGVTTAVARSADGSLAFYRRAEEEIPLLEETRESEARHRLDTPSPVRQLLLDTDQTLLIAALEDGRLALWHVSEDGEVRDARLTDPGPASVTSMTFLIGDRAVVVGRENGSIELWFPLRDDEGEYRLVPVREFPPHPSAVTELSPSMRNKSFLAYSRDGTLGLYHSTSHRTLWRGDSGITAASELLFSPRGDAGLVVSAPRIGRVEVDNPHPETSLRSLFGRSWYEGYRQPEFVWQSSSGSDDFEPKLSLTPLIFGTLKGTFYSLLLAIPLGVFGAMFASEFMHPRYKKVVKPTVEIMAALPSVVLGFLAGLWLAPRLETWFPALILMMVAAPVAVVGTGLAWARLPLRLRNRLADGSEVLIYAAVLVAVGFLCVRLSAPFERLVFDGSFALWLYETTGLEYDQRNAIVIGIAMGFAVIPIIFSVAEDAFSNVPRNLTSGSLALGANRWQTVTRVVLPTASPGIFSAIMIGFGRAVGETMIVLMATGNTPIMDWSPFNGFRTLSANIAVEIPEAPQGDTLYRTLFLAALLLFVITFVVNTAAEVVRHRLRRRYANL